MSSTHEFGLIDDITSQEHFDEYNPEKYNCISVEDEIVERLSKSLLTMKTYFHSLNRPEYGLAYHGVTIIPPDSLSSFYNVITLSSHFKNSIELNKLALKIQLAKKEEKHMIHYGI